MDKNQTDSGASADSQIEELKKIIKAQAKRITALEQQVKNHQHGGRQLRR